MGGKDTRRCDGCTPLYSTASTNYNADLGDICGGHVVKGRQALRAAPQDPKSDMGIFPICPDHDEDDDAYVSAIANVNGFGWTVICEGSM